jgi:DNA-binding transcriptional MerR regulator
MNGINEATLARIEKQHAGGLTSAEILDVFARHDIPLSEATLRKYVQLGLLPRSVRVGRKGKHQGSQGLYPPSVVRQILHIKRMMAQSYTIEQIQREFLFMRSELQQLMQTLGSIFSKLDLVVKQRRRQGETKLVAREIADARAISETLVTRLEAIETRLTSPVRIGNAAAS